MRDKIDNGKIDSIKKEKVFELSKENGKWKVIFSQIKKYKNTFGVWVMVNEAEDVLEVGQSSDIGEELNDDLSYLLNCYCDRKERIKPYTARRLFEFNERFVVSEYDKNRTTAKYRIIAEKNEIITVYRVMEDMALSDDRNEREYIEMVIAVDNTAKYWNAYGRQRHLAKEYYEKVNN